MNCLIYFVHATSKSSKLGIFVTLVIDLKIKKMRSRFFATLVKNGFTNPVYRVKYK